MSELTDEQVHDLCADIDPHDIMDHDIMVRFARSAYALGREEGLNELESWKIRHQDEVNARFEAENDLYAMRQERRREHSLRVKFAGGLYHLFHRSVS